MKQRLAIAGGLLRPRDLLVLDEPTNGLDPQGTREVRALIRYIAARRRHGVRLLPPARRGGADLHARRASCAGQAGAPGDVADLRSRGDAADAGPHAEPELAAAGLARLGLTDDHTVTGREVTAAARRAWRRRP